jgi:hypothetical protein
MGPRKEPIYINLFIQNVLASESPPGSLMGPLWRERYLPTGHSTICLNTPLFIFPSESLVRKPPPCSLTRSPRTGILSHQSLFIHSLIHSCICAGVPKRNPLAYREKYKVTVQGAPSRRKAYIQWGVAWFPKGIINDTAISTPVSCSLQYEKTSGWSVVGSGLAG